MARIIRFLHPYYIVNFLMLICYPVLRLLYGMPDSLRDTKTMLGWPKETEMMALGVVAIIVKYARAVTMEQFLDKIFLFGKMTNVALLFHFSRTGASFYITAAFGTLILLQPPKNHYQQLENMQLSTFEEEVKSFRKSDIPRATLLMFYCDWCKDCTLTEPIFVKVSTKHKRKDIRYAKIDLVRFPELAEDLNIDVSGTSWQLPTFILFYKGREIKRLPAFKGDGSVIKTQIDQKGLVKYFELDKELPQRSYYLKSKKNK
mmetsp:Transcript_28515/g.37302  ORF Transcript_28515/g.37302 Transcript_28515/m.37302 type:complete len:260 (-) Transcript_28515:192-971(-)